MHIQVGDSDQFFSLKAVRATRDALNEKGFATVLIEIAGHDHNYYDTATKTNNSAWEFLKKYQLDAEPIYRKFHFDN
jgi:hypothetical protein